ncbi:MAG: hypothetical protein P4N59_20020 [Negativicutes bacterium]|nr:hypothetical protein [Negativicutes bacterium]
MRIILAVLGIVCALLLTKWRHWKDYYPTIVFMIALNATMATITHDHRLWIFMPSSILTSHTVSDLMHTYITFPVTVLLFFSHYPRRKTHQLFFILAWAALYSWVEFLFEQLGLIVYTNGWSFLWSALFNCVMFPILRVHYQYPLLAWALSGLVLTFIWLHFGFTLEMLR